MDELRRRRAERLEHAPVQRLVGTVVVAADNVRDSEVDVVDHRREVIGRRAVLAQERHALEAVAERSPGLAVPLGAVALPHRALVPVDPEPLEVPQDRFLPALEISRGVRVVDPKQHPVAKAAVCDGTQRVAEMERARRARREADSDRHPASVRFCPRWSPGAQRFSAKTADSPLPSTAS